MTPQRIRYVHTLALKQKGLTDELYKLRLGRVGVESCKDLKKRQYFEFVNDLKKLPDAPGARPWSK